MYTAHHDPSHCFPETKNELSVQVYGDWMPRSIFGRFYALFAYIRMAWVALVMAFWSAPCDVIFCDQVQRLLISQSCTKHILFITACVWYRCLHAFPSCSLPGQGYFFIATSPTSCWHRFTLKFDSLSSKTVDSSCCTCHDNSPVGCYAAAPRFCHF